MTLHGFLDELVLVYALAIVLVMIGARLRVPTIVALIAAGVIAGPAGVGIMTSQEDVDLLAEIGVALLLFTAGLEFSLDDLRRFYIDSGPAIGISATCLGAHHSGNLPP